MKPTISLSYYSFLFIMFLFDTEYQYNLLFQGEMPREKIVVGKVRVAKTIGIIILYIGKIRFVIIEKGKRITERKEINQLVINVSGIQ